MYAIRSYYADDHDGTVTQAGPPPHDGLVVPEHPVPVELDPVGEDSIDVVLGERALGMSGDLDLLNSYNFV